MCWSRWHPGWSCSFTFTTLSRKIEWMVLWADDKQNSVGMKYYWPMQITYAITVIVSDKQIMKSNPEESCFSWGNGNTSTEDFCLQYHNRTLGKIGCKYVWVVVLQSIQVLVMLCNTRSFSAHLLFVVEICFCENVWLAEFCTWWETGKPSTWFFHKVPVTVPGPPRLELSKPPSQRLA